MKRKTVVHSLNSQLLKEVKCLKLSNLVGGKREEIIHLQLIPNGMVMIKVNSDSVQCNFMDKLV